MTQSEVNILLVEDNAPDAALLQASLGNQRYGQFRVTCARRLSEAIALSAQHPFDVVLLDLGLPDSQGLETLNGLRKRLVGTPIVVLTGMADEGLAVQALQQGAEDYLVKGEAEGRFLSRALLYAIERKAASERAHVRESELAHLARVSTVGHMAAGLAHELNQPLSAILNYAGVCLNQLNGDGGGSRDTMRVAMHELMNETRRAGAIISRLRSFLRKQKPYAISVDINEIVQEAIQLLAFELRYQGIQPHLRLGSTRNVSADPVQVEQVLVNLIYNALEAMSGGDYARKELFVTTAVQPDDSAAEVSVTDTGPGVSAQNMNRLFESFFTTKPEGLGMGLNISRSIIESHGGRLTAAANPEGGITFRFTLPVAPDGARK